MWNEIREFGLRLDRQDLRREVGDGMTDCEIKAVVQGFAAFTGFTRREAVIERADYVVENFDQLRDLILE